jgi:CRP/FNR family transcriptional regulator, cyclic AMP receptor protein
MRAQTFAPGEVLGLNASVAGIPHEATAETGQPCQLNFVKRTDFLKFLAEHGDACMHAAIHLGNLEDESLAFDRTA